MLKWIKKIPLIKWYLDKRKFKKRLEELKKRDPFIYR